MVDEFSEAARILVAQRQAARAVAVSRRDVRHAFFQHCFRKFARLGLECLVLVGMCAVTATGDDQRQRTR